MNTRLWGLLVLLLAALGTLSWWLSDAQTKPERIELKPPPVPGSEKQVKLKKATMEPGRVVVLNTTRGTIEFVLYEKDCPLTTSRIANLVKAGAYTGVKFPRVEDWVIQTAAAKREVVPMGIEVAEGLVHAKGAVGMARAVNVNTNTSIFYITLEPAHHLDLEYTTFGRVISGIDVAMKIKIGDAIKTATIRPFTATDRKHFDEALQVESERKTQ